MYSTDYYEYSMPELVKLLGARFKDHRLRAGMTQKDVSLESGVSVNTIHKFETGTSDNISLGTFLLLARVIGCLNDLDAFVPDISCSAYLVRGHRKIQRIRHKQS